MDQSTTITAVQEVYIWILGGVLGFLITAGMLVVSAYFKSLGEKIEALTESIQELSGNNAKQSEQISSLYAERVQVQERLNDHGKRIRKIEITCAREGHANIGD